MGPSCNTRPAKGCSGRSLVLNRVAVQRSKGRREIVSHALQLPSVIARRSRPILSVAAMAAASSILLAGCAGENAAHPPGAVYGGSKSCKESRRQLDRLDAQGVPSLIEASNSGRKLSKSQRGKVDLYNRLLQDYLGSRCHL